MNPKRVHKGHSTNIGTDHVLLSRIAQDHLVDRGQRLANMWHSDAFTLFKEQEPTLVKTSHFVNIPLTKASFFTTLPICSFLGGVMPHIDVHLHAIDHDRIAQVAAHHPLMAHALAQVCERGIKSKLFTVKDRKQFCQMFANLLCTNTRPEESLMRTLTRTLIYLNDQYDSQDKDFKLVRLGVLFLLWVCDGEVGEGKVALDRIPDLTLPIMTIGYLYSERFWETTSKHSDRSALVALRHTKDPVMPFYLGLFFGRRMKERLLRTPELRFQELLETDPESAVSIIYMSAINTPMRRKANDAYITYRIARSTDNIPIRIWVKDTHMIIRAFWGGHIPREMLKQIIGVTQATLMDQVERVVQTAYHALGEERTYTPRARGDFRRSPDH